MSVLLKMVLEFILDLNMRFCFILPCKKGLST